jgi:hypothetical protein
VTAKSESSTASGRAPLPGARWAVALGSAVLGGFLIVAVCGAIDRGRRGNIETVLQVTAVEDKTYYSIPTNRAERSTAAIRLGEHSLFLVSPNIVGIHDSDARRVATDSVTGLTIYETADPKALSAKERGNTYLLKVQTGKYVKVRLPDETNEK